MLAHERADPRTAATHSDSSANIGLQTEKWPFTRKTVRIQSTVMAGPYYSNRKGLCRVLEKLVTSDAEESPIFPSVRIAFSDNARHFFEIVRHRQGMIRMGWLVTQYGV